MLHEGVFGQMGDILKEKIAVPACMTLDGVSCTSRMQLSSEVVTDLLLGFDVKITILVMKHNR